MGWDFLKELNFERVESDHRVYVRKDMIIALSVDDF